MLMLYVFKVEVLDLGLNYSYSTDCVVIAETHEDRGRLIRCQFGNHNGSAVKHSVLLGARTLSCSEVALLERSAGTTGNPWLVTRVWRVTRAPHVRHLPRLESDEDMYELMERAPERYDSFPLMTDQYIHSKRFSQNGSAGASLAAPALIVA
jgi:hypothetical protein